MKQTKKSFFSIMLFSLILFSGCVKQENARPTPTSTKSIESMAKAISKSAKQQIEEVKNQEEQTKTENTMQNESDSELPTTSSFVASNMPADGIYINSTNGGFPHTCEIRIRKNDEHSFFFSIWEVIDENREASNNMIFMENIATFDSPDSTIATFYGQTYTVSFECTQSYEVTLSGFEPAVICGDSFLNIDAMERAQGLIP